MKHWAEDDFQKWVYGLKEEDRHLDKCAECHAELDRLRLKRHRIIEQGQPEVSQEFMAAQRRAVYRRLYEPRHNWVAWRWALSAAMLVVMVVGFTVQRGSRSASAITDEQLFSDLSAIEQSAEPKAIAPMHKLFEE